MASYLPSGSLGKYANAVANNPQLENDLKTDPKKALTEAAQNPAFVGSLAFYIVALLGLMLIAVICLIGIMVAGSNSNAITAFAGIGGAAVGGAAGVFTQSKGN